MSQPHYIVLVIHKPTLKDINQTLAYQSFIRLLKKYKECNCDKLPSYDPAKANFCQFCKDFMQLAGYTKELERKYDFLLDKGVKTDEIL